MSFLKVLWTRLSERQFDELEQRAAETNHASEFAQVHNEIVAILRDPEQAVEKGDPLYHTKKPGGTVRHFLCKFISVTFNIFPAEKVVWVTAYVPMPESWPE